MKFQIGKNGITQGVLDSLRLAFKTHKFVKITTLKNSGRNKEKIKEMANELVKRLEDKDYSFKYRVIGFTIIVKRSLKVG